MKLISQLASGLLALVWLFGLLGQSDLSVLFQYAFMGILLIPLACIALACFL